MSKPLDPDPILPSELEAVTGGTTTASSDSNDQLTTALQSITDSLKSLQNKNTNGFAQLMPFMMMMMMGGGGCGCGMRGCHRCGGGGCGGLGW